MHASVMEFLNRKNDLFDMQYGFRSGGSCDQALLSTQSQNLIHETLSKKSCYS